MARGRRLARGAALCSFCHGEDLAGREMVDDALVGVLWASNLTPGAGGIADWTDEDVGRAIRRGIRRDGRSLLLMPSAHLAALTDGDLRDVIAFLRQLEPVDRHTPETRVGLLTRVVLVLGGAPELLAAERAAGRRHPPPDSRDPGAYWVSVGSCRVCHSDDLRGGLHPLALPDEPEPPDITGTGPSAKWSQSQFARAMRTGSTPDGRQLDPAYMPWPHFAALDDRDLAALARYLRSR